MMKHFNTKLLNKSLREFFKEHEASIMVRVDDINDDTVTLTVGFGDGSDEFYMVFGSIILAKGWKATIESPKLTFNLADFISFV